MSEYQYYEFRTIDAPLTERAMAALRRISSRADITATSLSVEYNFGDFRGDPDRLMEKYFDAHVYVTNRGSRVLMFRFPSSAVKVATLRPFMDGEVMRLRSKDRYTALGFHRENAEDGDWIEGDRWLSSLLPIRQEILTGDRRALYIGWLTARSQTSDEEDGDGASDDDDGGKSPPVPPGMGKLTVAQKELIEFFGVDPKDVTKVAEKSAPRAKGVTTRRPARASSRRR